MKKNKTETFINSANIVHGNKYDYSKSFYINARTKIEIICPAHGIFEQTPDNHLHGNECPACANRKRSTTEEFIVRSREVHGEKYDYSVSKYTNNIDKVKIICREHGIFEQSPVKHINGGNGCPICAKKTRREKKTNDTVSFIKKSILAHGDKYDYSKANYINNSTKVKIVCPYHGEFEQSPDKHMSGQDCPICKTSKGEKRINIYLENNNIRFKYQYRFSNCKNEQPLPFDFYLPERNICIEYDGRQHYNKDTRYYTERLVENDGIKTQFCIKYNIDLIRIPY